MKRKYLCIAILVLLGLRASAWPAESTQKIRIGFPSLAFSYLQSP